MAKSTAAFDLALGPVPAGVSKVQWVHAALKAGIHDGRLPPGTRLPSTRALAAAYALSRSTVVEAFELLAAEGYLRSATGSGSWVAPLRLRTEGSQRPGRAAVPADASARQLARRAGPLRNIRFATPGPSVDVTLFPYYPALDLFPLELWQRTLVRRVRRLDRAAMINQQPLGYLPLRAAIADYLHVSRGIVCNAERIAIVTGVQQALDIVARLVADAGDVALVEDPCYPGAVAALRSAGLVLEPVPVDDEGLRVGAARSTRPRLAFVTPAHQSPLGVIMSAQRRVELLAWARRHDALVFEDDYDSEYRYAGRPVPALASLSSEGAEERVVSFGSFTKTLYPSLRIGYVVLPEWLVQPFESAIAVATRYPEPVLQQSLFDFIVQGHYARHIHRMRTRYGERREDLARELDRHLGGRLRLAALGDGLATIAWLSEGRADALAAAAASHQLAAVPLSRYVVEQRRSEALVLGFANAAPAALRRAVRLLARASNETPLA